MAGFSDRSAAAWRLVRRQHGVITRAQLRELGFTDRAIEHRLATARLHPVYRCVYAVGRAELHQHGRWMAAVLACGAGALLSHRSAAELWGIRKQPRGRIEVSIVSDAPRRVKRLLVHRRRALSETDITEHQGIPVTSPVCTLIDLATVIARDAVEAAVNEADRLNLVDPEALRAALYETAPRPGVGVLRDLLDRQTFKFTRSELERRFWRLAREAGLPDPETCVVVNGYEVDFYWPDIPLIVETDGLKYHRTPTQQKKDRLRDQAHTAAGIPHLRFTHAQVRDEPAYVRVTLAKAMARLLSLLLLLAALAIAGCGDDGNDEPPPTPPPKTSEPERPSAEKDGVVLSLDRDSPHAGETIRLTVENRTETRLEYGLMYRLEHRVGGEWRWINRDAAFALILKIAEPGKREHEEIRLPDDLKPGRYRIVKSFTAPATGREIEVAVGFSVAAA